jgi:hypothetical protein
MIHRFLKLFGRESFRAIADQRLTALWSLPRDQVRGNAQEYLDPSGLCQRRHETRMIPGATADSACAGCRTQAPQTRSNSAINCFALSFQVSQGISSERGCSFCSYNANQPASRSAISWVSVPSK